MKKMRVVAVVFMALNLAVMLVSAVKAEAAWQGVDESVVEKLAEQAGRPARPPLINTDQGDLLLFMFLLAGTTGGFIGGYFFRGLFAPRGACQALKPRREAPPNA